jgi:cholesterol oxidase
VNGTARKADDSGEPSGATSLTFTEEMKGFYADGVNAPGAGEIAGRENGQRLGFRLTITVDDVDRFLKEPEHTAQAEGWIDAAGCGGRCQVERGWFNLFSPGDAPDRRLMRYRLHFTDGMGRPRTLSGWKDVRHRPTSRLWRDTTTLFFRLYEGHVPDGDDEEAAIAGATWASMTSRGSSRRSVPTARMACPSWSGSAGSSSVSCGTSTGRWPEPGTTGLNRGRRPFPG